MTPQRYAKLKEILRQRQPDLTVLTDGVHKPHNISAILRTCDAVGIAKLHAVTPDSELRQHHMMAGGSKRWVDVESHASTAEALAVLQRDNMQIVVADATANAIDYRAYDYCQPTAIVVGAELLGPSTLIRESADVRIAIPMHGLVESLNVSVATALILFEAERQRTDAGMYETCRLTDSEFEKKLFEWSHPDIARRCRDRGVDYPALTADGDLATNPF